MNVNEHTSGDIDTHGGGERPPSTWLTPDALPEVQKPVLAENSQTGVSTRNALSGTDGTASGEAKLAVTIPSRDGRRVGNSTDDIPRGEGGKAIGSTPPITIKRKPKDVPHWYALRVTYGREKKAYDYLVGKHVEAYYPTITTIKIVDGKRKSVEESRLPNIFFARGTEEEIKSFVYDNVNLPFLRFYYKHTHTGARIIKTPLIVPDNQIKSLQIICEKEGSDTLVLQEEVTKFKQGEKVKIIEGDFVGVTGIVARYHGQQRVGLVIDGLLTAVTAYIPTAFLIKI